MTRSLCLIALSLLMMNSKIALASVACEGPACLLPQAQEISQMITPLLNAADQLEREEKATYAPVRQHYQKLLTEPVLIFVKESSDPSYVLNRMVLPQFRGPRDREISKFDFESFLMNEESLQARIDNFQQIAQTVIPAYANEAAEFHQQYSEMSSKLTPEEFRLAYPGLQEKAIQIKQRYHNVDSAVFQSHEISKQLQIMSTQQNILLQTQLTGFKIDVLKMAYYQKRQSDQILAPSCLGGFADSFRLQDLPLANVEQTQAYLSFVNRVADGQAHIECVDLGPSQLFQPPAWSEGNDLKIVRNSMGWWGKAYMARIILNEVLHLENSLSK